MTNADEPVIRQARTIDAAGIAALSVELGYPAPMEEFEERLRALDGNADHRVLVVDTGGKVAAWLHVSLVESLETGPFAEIRGLVVTEALRSRGIGAALVAAAERWAVERGCAKIRVRSNALRTRARTFYERLDYVVTKQQNVLDKKLASGD